MQDLKPTCRIAVVQAAPVLFDKTACTDKAVRLIAECARSGAELIVFPELIIPCYPYGDGAPRRGGKGRGRVCEHRRVGARRRDGHAL